MVKLYMEYSCDNDSFYSHPTILLKDHLKVVGDMCETKIREILGDNELSSIAKIIGLTHDFGKYNIFFQEYLKYKKRENNELISHAPLSSLYTGWVLRHVLHQQISDPFLIYAAMLCVYCHHRSINLSFPCLKEKFRKFTTNDNYRKQLASLRKNSHIISRELNELNLPPIDHFLDNIDRIVEDFKKLCYNIKNNSSYSEALTNLYRLLLLFSVLIDSDKKVAGNIGELDSVDIPVCIVDNYIEKRLKHENNNNLDKLRNDIRFNVLNNLKGLLTEGIPPILSINAPTGSGKTLLALNVALRIRERLKEKTNKHFRIIYVLPYINIIEQTYNVFADILGNKVTPSLLIKHHHLYYPEENSEELDNDTRFMLIESWDSEIIVTTLVQFMETLLGTRNRMLKKFHKLFNSIIILDEVQAVPLDYWLLLRESVKVLSQHSYIIFMTATKPTIFKSDEYKELVTNSADNFKSLNRVQYRISNNTINIDDFANMINNEWKNSNSLLIIVNKIRTSIQLYNKLKEILLDNYDVICVEKVNGSILEYKDLRDSRSYKSEIEKVDKPVLVYLSTNIVPKERINRILLLAYLLKKGHKVLVVSTQLVEAGVDLDFDMVIRDIGPFDSIIQAAGRCNRNGIKDKGSVLIVRLSDDKEGLDAEDVYGKLTISVTNEVLEGVDMFTEADIFDMINKYYTLVNQKLNTDNSDKSMEYLKYIKEFDLQGLSKFKVIKEPRTAVFVEIDPDASNVLKKFTEVLCKNYDDKYSVYKKKAEIRKSRIRLEEYIINTWHSENLPTQTIADTIDIKYIDTQSINIYYNYETGLNIGSEVNESYEFL